MQKRLRGHPQLRINTDYSHHRYDAILLINGVPVAQVELKTLGVSPRRAMQQIADYKADKVIVTTIQKLGLALDETSRRNRQREQQGRETYRELLAPLRDKRFVFIFDECHRSQFGDNHDAIKEFFPRDQLVGLIRSEARFMDDGRLIVEYIDSPGTVRGRSEKEIRAGFERFRDERHAAELAALGQKHALPTERLQTFVDAILRRLVFDGEQLTELLAPLGLNWKARRVAELALMEQLVPLLKKRATGREISGLNAYES